MSNQMPINTSNGSFTKACKELAVANKKLLNFLKINYKVVNDAPTSYSKLMKYKHSSFLPISGDGCKSSIYGSEENNHIFRAIHDYIHINNELTFNYEDEMKVCDIHLELLEGYNLSDLARLLLEIDVKGQIMYYDKHKRFVKDQLNFAWCMLLTIKRTGSFNLPQGVF